MRSRAYVGVCAVALAALLGCGSGGAGSNVEPDGTERKEQSGREDAPGVDAASELDGEGGQTADVTLPVVNNGVTARREGDELVLENERLRVRFRIEAGRFSVETAEGLLLLSNAEARALEYAGTAEGETHKSSEREFAGWTAVQTSGPLGDGVRLAVELASGSSKKPDFRMELELLGNASYLLARLDVRAPAGDAGADMRWLELSPLVLDQETGGALFVGNDPAKHAVVDDGTDMYFDFAARVYRVGTGDSFFFPGRGGVANWNTLLHEPASGRSLAAGFFSFTHGIGLIANDYSSTNAPEDQGRKGFTRFEGFVRYDPSRGWEEDADGLFVASEWLYVDFLPETPFDGLEQYASRYATFHGKKLWADIPTGWNSWGGGSGEGGVGTNIDEAMILANLEAMEEDFVPFGMRYFLIDDGWQKSHGDWETDPEVFPPHDGLEGMAWMAKHVKEKGLIPGIWIAPFWVKMDSKFAQEHADWLAPKNELASALMGDKDAILDLANPEVLAYLHDLFHKITQVWGFKWIKMDFAYYALFAEELYGNREGAAGAFHNALSVIRDAIGPETFFLTISAMGLCFDAADGARTTLDNQPAWGDVEDQGIKVTLRTAAHRYYLNNLWSNHHDLLFYRPTIGLTLNEARAWTSVVALMGGIVKLGEQFTAMHEHPEWLSMVRPIIPVYPHSARPLDMFELNHPEVWHLPVHLGERSWDVVGFFNWGKTHEIMFSSGKEVPEQPRSKVLALSAIGRQDDGPCVAIDAWEGTCHEIAGQSLEAYLQPRSDRVLVLQCGLSSDVPRILKTSRHLLGGVVEILAEEVSKDADGRTVLEATIDSPAGFPLEVLVHGGALGEPDVEAPADAEISVASGDCKGVLAVSVLPESSPVELKLRY